MRCIIICRNHALDSSLIGDVRVSSRRRPLALGVLLCENVTLIGAGLRGRFGETESLAPL